MIQPSSPKEKARLEEKCAPTPSPSHGKQTLHGRLNFCATNHRDKMGDRDKMLSVDSSSHVVCARSSCTARLTQAPAVLVVLARPDPDAWVERLQLKSVVLTRFSPLRSQVRGSGLDHAQAHAEHLEG